MNDVNLRGVWVGLYLEEENPWIFVRLTKHLFGENNAGDTYKPKKVAVRRQFFSSQRL
jgi:hypothetical protein